MPTIERDGATIGYDVTGDGPPVLMGHSLLCDRRMWEGVAPKLAETHKVINIDFRGHGESTAPGPFTFADLVEDWLAIMDAEKIEQAVLCGLSMGGMTGMRLALRAPQRVRGLILVDSNAAQETWFRRIKYKALAILYRRYGMSERLKKQVAPIMVSPTTIEERPELVETFAERVREFDKEQLTHAIAAVNGRGPIGDISLIDAPTLVLVGEHDVATPPFRSEEIHQAIAGSVLVRIPQAGHLSAMEQPERVTAEIQSFLDGLD